ncbi:MAG: hypothetical protein LBU39_06175 [Desulfobulbaceae bacterium]|nr:hypothetical protein [Desulfobulbaceae bacterium]
MKKQLTTLLVLAALTAGGMAMAATPADQPTMNCPKMTAQTDPAMREKMDKFYKDTSDLRKQIAMKRAELDAVTNAAQPDTVAAARMAGELYDLRASLQAQAQAAGLGQFGPGCGLGGGHGFGHGGRHHGGFNN